MFLLTLSHFLSYTRSHVLQIFHSGFVLSVPVVYMVNVNLLIHPGEDPFDEHSKLDTSDVKSKHSFLSDSRLLFE